MFRARRGLRVRHEATELARIVFAVVDSMPRGARGDLGDQLRRAASSVYANLAEGEGRESPADRGRFYRMAWASLRELEAHLAFAATLRVLPVEAGPELRTGCQRVGRLLYALVRSPRTPP